MPKIKVGLMSKADLILFFQETWARAWKPTPKFFRVMGWISMTMAIVGCAPDIISYFEIAQTPLWMKIAGYCLKAAGAWGKLQALMPVSKPSTEIMPFTEKKQIQQAFKAEETFNNALK